MAVPTRPDLPLTLSIIRMRPAPKLEFMATPLAMMSGSW